MVSKCVTRVYTDEKNRSKKWKFASISMATLQVQQRNSPPVITYTNVLISSECTANGCWLNTKGVIRQPPRILFAPIPKNKARGAACAAGRLVSVGDSPYARVCAGQGRAATLRTYRMCELVVRHAAKLQDISLMAARCCVSVVHGGNEKPSISRHGKRSKPC